MEDIFAEIEPIYEIEIMECNHGHPIIKRPKSWREKLEMFLILLYFYRMCGSFTYLQQ